MVDLKLAVPSMRSQKIVGEGFEEKGGGASSKTLFESFKDIQVCSFLNLEFKYVCRDGKFYGERD